MRRSPASPVPLLVLIVLLAGAAALPAASRVDFDKVADFSVTLKDLAAAADGKAALPTGRMLVLTGTVAGVTILDKEEATFRVRVEIITGEWLGTEEVKSYSAYVEYAGPEYFRVFPARGPARATAGVVVTGSRLLVVARAVGVTATPSGDARRVLLDGAYVRVIP
jgi:hypothetical protein